MEGSPQSVTDRGSWSTGDVPVATKHTIHSNPSGKWHNCLGLSVLLGISQSNMVWKRTCMREPLRGYQCQFRPAPVSHSWNHPPMDATTWADGHWAGFIVLKEGLTSVDKTSLSLQRTICAMYMSIGDNTKACNSSHDLLVSHYNRIQVEQD